jgi:hypothetical protein
MPTFGISLPSVAGAVVIILDGVHPGLDIARNIDRGRPAQSSWSNAGTSTTRTWLSRRANLRPPSLFITCSSSSLVCRTIDPPGPTWGLRRITPRTDNRSPSAGSGAQ